MRSLRGRKGYNANEKAVWENAERICSWSARSAMRGGFRADKDALPAASLTGSDTCDIRVSGPFDVQKAGQTAAFPDPGAVREIYRTNSEAQSCLCLYNRLQKRRDAGMDMKQMKENKLKMILQFSIPSVIAMLLETLITVTDGYFTGNYVGEAALAAINLGLPVLYFYLGAGLCVGVGGSVICGRLLGAEKKEKASEVFTQTLTTAVAVCVIISALVSVLFTPILKVLRADGELSVYFTQY